MGKQNNFIKIFIVAILFLSVFISLNISYAADPTEKTGIQKAFDITNSNSPLPSAAEGGVGFNRDVSFNDIVAIIISSVLSIMGALFLVLMIYAGYTWMTARGEEEKVEKAKNTLTNAIIGLVVVMAAYAISYFVLSRISPTVLKESPGAGQPAEEIL